MARGNGSVGPLRRRMLREGSILSMQGQHSLRRLQTVGRREWREEHHELYCVRHNGAGTRLRKEGHENRIFYIGVALQAERREAGG